VPSARRYDAVLFDFSGVMIDSAFTAIAKIGGDAGADRTLELLLGPYDRDTDHPWHRVERGEIPITDWVTEVSEQAARDGVTLDFDQLGSFLANADVRDDMVAEVLALRADGYRTALVTNNVREASDSWRQMLALDDLFDVVVDSSSVGVRKPDPRIYLLALEQLGDVSPARAVFLDDHPGNVAGAERAGLVAVLVDDPAVAIAELRELLGRTLADGAELPAPPGA
jgi:epoxide hydrolase-like predicted phosphatase